MHVHVPLLDLDRYFQNVTEQDLDSLLRAGEGPQIELKERLSSIPELARNVSALANTDGGVIVVGAREAKPQIVFGGRDPQVAEFFDNLAKRLHPLPDLMMHRVNYRGVTVPVIVVKPHPSDLVVSDDGAFVREGDANKRMTAAEIQAKLPPQPDPVTNEHLAKSISAMSEQIETLRKDLKYAQSLKGQWQVLLVGFVLGILASIEDRSLSETDLPSPDCRRKKWRREEHRSR